MRKPPVQIDTATALAYLGKAVLLELYMDEDEPPYWCCKHIVGVVLTKDDVWDFPYFMTISLPSDGRTPFEVPFNDILSIRVMQHRDRHGSGNVLDCITHPNSAESGAVLPARRNSSTVPSNGSTGVAHP